MYNETMNQHTLHSAVEFNKRNAHKLVVGTVPQQAIDEYPGLGECFSSDRFSHSVFQLQKDLGLMVDGKLGKQTWGAVLSKYDEVPTSSHYVVHSGRRIKLPVRESYRVICFDELQSQDISSGITPLDLHPEGNFSKRRKGIDKVIMHWGGLNPKHLYNVMSSPDRSVSTHFGIGLIEGEPVVVQYLDIKHKAWHAGFGNEGSIGVDICQQPSYKWIGYYQKEGYLVKKEDNPTNRGNKNIISLDPRIAEATRDFVSDLLTAMGLAHDTPLSHGVLAREEVEEGEFTLMGHHHLVSKKWDIACWWSSIFEGTDLDV